MRFNLTTGGAILVYLLLPVVFFYVLYVVVRAAVRAALLDRRKTVRWFEQTGEWHAGAWQSRAPRDPSEGLIAKLKQGQEGSLRRYGPAEELT